METFPDIPPSYQSNKRTDFATLTANFGEGYTQRARDGLNSLRRAWSLVWNNLSNADTDTIVNFLNAHQGDEAFHWNDPITNTNELVTCSFYTETYNSYNATSISATFTEQFDIT